MRSVFPFLILLLFTVFASSTVFSQQPDSLAELQRQVDILTQEIEKIKLGEVAENRYEPQRGLGPAAAKVYSLKKSGVSLAGYGEAVYENYSTQREDGNASNKLDRVDFLRNILYVGFRFNDWILFNSEIEFEHGSTGKTDSKGKSIGEVSVEFGYVELMFSRSLNLRAGMLLNPVGIVNEKHEPSTFFGTLRPNVDRVIIPSTWRANGIGFYGELAPSLDYRAYLVEGLDAASFSDASGIRGGRQSGAKALAEDLGLTGKLEYTGIPGSTLGGSFYYGKSGQGAKDSQGTIDALTTLLSVHGEYAWKGFEFRGLYAKVDLDEADRVSKLAGKTVGSSMYGWYLSAGYDIIPRIVPGSSHYLAPYIQYERFNTHATVAAGYSPNPNYDQTVIVYGLSYKPHPNIAFKLDYWNNQNAARTGISQWNVALNYLF